MREEVMSMVVEPELLRAEEVAKVLSIARSTVFELMAARELPVVRIGRAVRVPREALRQWINERTENRSEPPASLGWRR
jgi:excisionase family DNA binding protein